MKKNSVLAFANDLNSLFVSDEQSTTAYDLTGDGITIGIFEGELTIIENQSAKSIDAANTIEIELAHPQGFRSLQLLPGKEPNTGETDSFIVIATDMIGSLTDGTSFLSQLPQNNAVWNNLTTTKEIVNLEKGNYVMKVNGGKLTIGLVNPSA